MLHKKKSIGISKMACCIAAMAWNRKLETWQYWGWCRLLFRISRHYNMIIKIMTYFLLKSIFLFFVMQCHSNIFLLPFNQFSRVKLSSGLQECQLMNIYVSERLSYLRQSFESFFLFYFANFFFVSNLLIHKWNNSRPFEVIYCHHLMTNYYACIFSNKQGHQWN